MHSKDARGWGCRAALVLVCAATLHAQSYIGDGEIVTPARDPSRLAVWRCNTEAADLALADALAESGVAVARIEPFILPGWSIVTLGDARGVDEATLATLAADEALDFVSPVFRDHRGDPLIVTPDILVRFTAAADRAVHAELLLQVGVERVLAADWAGMPGAYRVRHGARDGLSVLAAAAALALQPGVAYAEPDLIVTGRAARLPNDPEFPLQWGLHNIGQSGGLVDMDVDAPAAWDLTTGAPTVLVLILDTGVEQSHPDLNQIPGADFTTDAGDGGPQNACDKHGTWVAGCVSAHIDNNRGVVGLAPTARVASARIGISNPACNLSWSGQLSWTVDALMWGESLGVRVTNNSNAYAIPSTAIREKYEQLRAAGVIHFAAAGNDGSVGLAWPARLDAVNGVGAIDRFGVRTAWSNYGSGLAFMAPGAEIRTTDRTGPAGGDSGDYATVNGTSFAAPHGAGAAALVLTLDPFLSALDAEKVLRFSCTDIYAPGFDSDSGAGVVNAADALQFARTYRLWAPRAGSGPPAAGNAAMAYDRARGVSVLFGGSAGATTHNQTWEWDGVAWTQRTPATTTPAARSGHAMVYDSARGVTVMFGGFVGAAPTAQTWEWDGHDWTLRSLPHNPPARILHALAYDAARQRIVLFGGRNSSFTLLGDTWEYDGTDWTLRATGGPAPRDYAAMAYDAARGHTVLYGGSAGGTELWTWNGAAWVAVSYGSGPGPRNRHALAYDERRGTVLLFGGQDGAGLCRPETYEWDGALWTLRTLAGPAARSAFAWAYDADRAEVVLFGGVCGSTTYADTWAGRVRERTAGGLLHSLSGPSVAFDPANGCADLNGDGAVDLLDVALLAREYGLP